MNYPKVTAAVVRDRIKEQTCLDSHCGFFASYPSAVSSVEGLCVCMHTYRQMVAIEVDWVLYWLGLADKYRVEVSAHVHTTL